MTHAAAQAYYDRFGKKQDSQGFYEDRALNDLVAHAGFQGSRRVFEFGCGTGKFAARLLEQHLPPSASYLGCDVSPVMVGLAKRRLGAYGERAQVVLSDGAVRFPLPDHSVDRVVSSYVLDLLSEANIKRFFSESHRVMMPGGTVCIASLTRGVSISSRIVSSLWTSVFRLSPALVGGCRPIHVDAFVDPQEWQVVHRSVVTPFGVPSEILILERKDTPNKCTGADGAMRYGATRASGVQTEANH
ncbi:MAG TPA: class I SAM-dependent methyltransferase [Paraburkholderia sp.]|uniref:class I SAM-dependent methyltransferase n=1 Tax=Paraburkholderia sp. TaxID=1926495 RepID=UPI002B4785FD|nr:class I SAM-dependent methyltransferase [Paraburkholderia sp.]HKR43029.1 class I SAM-dependent methyltransferase [Paraburkholderia sp.]